MKLLILGAPGSGKGTQAEKIVKKYHLRYIDTGNILRKNEKVKTKKGTPRDFIKKGVLVPDYIVLEFVVPFIKRATNSDFILDGFPRSLKQVKILEELTDIDAAIYLDVKPKKLIKRISGRRICKKCGSSYHLELKPPKKENICDNCGNKLTQREDDKPKIVKKRTKVFKKSLKPVIKYYERKGILKKIDANKEPNEVWKNIQKVLRKTK